MIASRTAARSARALSRAPIRAKIRHVRPQSTSSSSQSAAAAGGTSGFVAGMAGGAVVFAAGYGYYYFSGTKAIVNTATETKRKFDEAAKAVKDQAPEPNEALAWLRKTLTAYSSFIPGAKPYIDSTFDDLDKVEENHRGEANKIVSDAYSEMKEATKGGLTMETAQKSWEILAKYLKQLTDLASDSAGDILDNHPEIKEKVGGNLDELKSMANSYGSEAKDQLDDTYSKIKDIMAAGVGVEAITKIKQLIDEKTKKIKEMGDDAWKKGMEQAKPYLDKNAEIKKVIEENVETLKQGNFKELFEKIKKGDIGDLKKYVQEAGDKVKNSSIGKKVQGMSDEAWSKGMEKAKPYLDKNAEIKKAIEENVDALKQGNFEELFEKIKKGDVEELKKFVKQAEDKVKNSSVGKKVQGMSDEAWKKGMEKAKPYLDKNAEIKKAIEENVDALKQGNFEELFEKIKKGDVEDLKKYVKQAGDKAKNSSVGKSIEQYAKMIPGVDEIWPKMSQLQEVAKKRGDEAEKILKDTYKEIADILSKKTKDVEKLAEKTKEEATK